MVNTAPKDLQESLDKVAQSLIEKVEQVELNLSHSFTEINEQKDDSENKINIVKITIGAISTASVGLAIAYFANENKLLFSLIGGGLGIISSYFNQKKKQGLKPITKEPTVDILQFRKEVLRDIRTKNEYIRQEWESAMQQLTEDHRQAIKQMNWTDEQKELATSNLLIYKSIIITDYDYTDAIEDLMINENFQANIKRLFIKWKSDIIEIINKTKKDQWEDYFSKIYKHQLNKC